jgi:hypothetical protein
MHDLGVLYSDRLCPRCEGQAYPEDPRNMYPWWDQARGHSLLQVAVALVRKHGLAEHDPDAECFAAEAEAALVFGPIDFLEW